MQKEFQLAVDIEKKILTPSFEVNTLDLKTIKLKITITKGMTLVDLTDITVRMSIRKPDGNVLFQDCQVVNAKGGQVEIILENQAYIMPGSYSAEIMCFKGTDKVAVTGSFSYRSIRGIMDDKAIESKSEFTAITGMIGNVESIVDDLKKNGTGIDAQARQEVEQVSALLAEVAKRGFVTYRQFGAKLNGIDDDTQAVVETHNYANEHGVRVIQNIGTLYLKTANEIIVKTPLDLRGCDIKVDETLGNRTIYKVVSDYQEETITITPALKSELIENTTTIPSLSSRKFNIYKVTSDDAFATRSNGEAHTKTESFVSLSNGVLADGGLIFGYTSSANLRITARSVQDKPIEIYSGNIRINTNDNTKIPKMFYITRSNVVLGNVNVFVESMPVNTNTSTTVYKNNIVQVDFSYNVRVQDFSGDGITAENQDETSVQQSGGILSINYSSFVYVARFNMLRGHGTIGSGWVKKIYVADCLINRIDCHYVHRDFNIDNITFVGNNNGLVIGWGKGTWNVRNLKYQQADTSNYPGNSVIFLRTDIGAVFEGDIFVDGLEMNVIENLTSCNIVQGYFVENYAYNATVVHKLPKISLNNVRINTKHATRVYGFSLQVNGDYYDTHPLQLSELNLSNVSFEKANTGSNFQTLFAKFHNNGVSGKMKINIDNVDLGLSLSNAGQNAIEIIDLRSSVTETADVKIKGSQFELKLDKARVGLLFADRCKIRTNISNGGKISTLETRDCEGNSLVGMNNLIMNNSSANYLDNAVVTAKVKNSTISGYLTSSTSTTYAEFDNCVITPAIQSGQSQLKLTNAILRNNTIKQNGTNPIYLNTTLFSSKCLFLNNVVEGSVVSATDTNNLWKYIGSAYQTPAG